MARSSRQRSCSPTSRPPWQRGASWRQRSSRSAPTTSGRRERNREIAVSQAELLDSNQELTTANADLRSANEELLVANEEVQAATEEVETLNEELQATNEELETLNEELQATVEELNTTNDDLQARSVELQETSLTLDRLSQRAEADRLRLERLFDQVERGVALFGPAGEVVLANGRYQEVLGGTADVLDEHGEPLADDQAPVARAARGEAFQQRIQLRKGRRRPEPFDVISTPLDGSDAGYTVLLVQSAD